MEQQNENHSCFCITFLNEEGVKEMQEYQFDNYTENMFVQELSYEEANSIYLSILDKFNQDLGLLIDFFEEEDLPNEKLDSAKKILDIFLAGEITEIQKKAALKIKTVIEKAIETKTYVCFEF